MPKHSTHKTTAPGPGTYELVDPGLTNMPSSPKPLWGNRGVWSDVDHVELQKQKAKGYGRYMTAEGRQNLAEMSMTRYGGPKECASRVIHHTRNSFDLITRDHVTGKGCGYSGMHHALWRHWGPTEPHRHLPPSRLIIGGRLM